MAIRTIIHLSDLHIGINRKECDRFITIGDRIAKEFAGSPILITGDLTDSATESQFKQTRRLLDQLAMSNPILSVPGNHDYAWKGTIFRNDAWEYWLKYLGAPLGWDRDEVLWMSPDHDPEGVDGLGIWIDGPCVYFGIDSGDPENKQHSAKGYISEALANGLNKSLKRHSGKTRVAFLHHHPFTEGVFTKLAGSEILLDALKNHCELLLFGHHHEYGIWWKQRNIPLIVSSHKSTEFLSGNCLMITIIDIENAGTPHVSFNHRIEVM